MLDTLPRSPLLKEFLTVLLEAPSKRSPALTIVLGMVLIRAPFSGLSIVALTRMLLQALISESSIVELDALTPEALISKYSIITVGAFLLGALFGEALESHARLAPSRNS